MTKKLLSVCAVAAALLSTTWANPWSVYASYGNTPNFSYWQDTYGSGTVFTATVSGYGPGNGVSFVQDAYTGTYYVFVGPGTGSSQSFYASQSSSPLSSSAVVTLGISATSNGVGGYCTSTLSAGW